MSKVFRLGLAFVVIAGTLVGLSPGAASAGSGASTVPTVSSPLTVGDTGTFSMRLENDNETNPGEPVDFGDLTNTVCNRIPQPGTNCTTSIEGITFMPSCGSGGGNDAMCDVADPDVFELAPSAVGTAGSCLGLVFDVVPTGDDFGRYLFTPQNSASVELAGPDIDPANSVCRISFDYTVISLPTIDADPGAAGLQTIAVADNTQSVETTENNASGRGQSFPMTISPAQPFISTIASADTALGAEPLTDSASMSGRQFPTDGSVTFRLYGPDDETCSGLPVFVDENVPYAASPANGATITSAPFTPTSIGTYRWVANYNGDDNNLADSGECNDANESTVVTESNPTISTSASADGELGIDLVDTATLSGVVNPQPGATVTFNLYGPDDDDCSNDPISTSTVPFPLTGTDVESEAFTPTVTGTYQWVAEYTGDVNNNAASGECGDPDETTVVSKASPVLATQASANSFIDDGVPLVDTATLTGVFEPGNSTTIDFRLYGPDNADCSGTPIFESLDVAYPVDGAEVSSGSFVPTLPGIYRWVASYDGDDNNNATEGVCGDPTETTTVSPTPDVEVELPATGPEDVGTLTLIGFAMLLAGAGLLSLSGRRRYV